MNFLYYLSDFSGQSLLLFFSCFTLGLNPKKVQALFQINFKKGDKDILENIKKALGVGHISPMGIQLLNIK